MSTGHETHDAAREPSAAVPSPPIHYRSRAPMVVAIVSLLLAVCAAGAATYLWFELDDVRTKSAQDTIVTSIKVATVDGRVDSLEGDSEHFDSLAGRVANLESSIATAEQDIIDNVESDSDASDAIEALGWCINAYIDYVENGIGPYYYC